MASYYCFKGIDELGTERYIQLPPDTDDIDQSRLAAYPHRSNNTTQQWRFDGARIVSCVAPVFCLSVRDITDGSVVYLRRVDDSDPGLCAKDSWTWENGIIRLVFQPDFYLGLHFEKVLLRKQRKHHAVTKWRTLSVDDVMKPAARCDIQYGPITQNKITDAWALQNTARVRKCADHTYICVIGWGPGGYCSLEQNIGGARSVVFSMWDNVNHRVHECSNGSGVRVVAFDSHGTGLRAEKQLTWKVDTDITLKVTGVKEQQGNQVVWKCSCYYMIVEEFTWHFIAAFRRGGEQPFNQHFYSSLDDMERVANCEGHVVQRAVEFSQPTLTTSMGVTIPLREAIFTKRGNDCYELGAVKGFGAVNKSRESFLLTTGGENGTYVERELLGDGYEQIRSKNLSTLCL